MIITDFRAAVVDVLTSTASVPVIGFLPDDVAELPVLVVGRPSIREAGIKALMALSLDVTLLGRRISDDDSQAELDALADELFTNLGGTRNVKSNDLMLRCTLILPATVLVAGLEYPAYLATVTTDTMTC